MADKKITATLLATLAASLCCVTPVLAVLAGTSSFAGTFSWMEPYRGYLAGLAVLVLLYAWWDKLRPKKGAPECACDETGKSAFFSGKIFLAIVTLFVIAMLSFPQWGYGYVETQNACSSCVVEVKESAPEQAEPVSGKEFSPRAEEKKEPPVVKYMSDEKANPTACNQIACSGTGRPEVDALMSKARGEVEEMSPAVLKKMLDNEEDLIILDIRGASQHAEGEIYADKYYAIERGDLEFEIMNMIKDKDALVITYCRTGSRGLFAAQTLKHLGYKNAYNLAGGLQGWARAGYPFENGLGIVLKVEEQ